MTSLPKTISSRRKGQISMPHSRSSSFDKITTTLHNFQSINTKLIDAIASSTEQQKLMKNIDTINIPSYKADKSMTKMNTHRYGLWSTQKDFKMPNTVRAVPIKKTAQTRRPSFSKKFANMKLEGSLPNLLSSTLNSGLTTTNLSPTGQGKLTADQEKRIDQQININFRFKPAHQTQAQKSSRERLSTADHLDRSGPRFENSLYPSATFRESAGFTATSRFSRRSSVRKVISPGRLTSRDGSQAFLENLPSNQILPSVLGGQEFDDFTDEIQENLNQRKIGTSASTRPRAISPILKKSQSQQQIHNTTLRRNESLNTSRDGKLNKQNNTTQMNLTLNTTKGKSFHKRSVSLVKSRTGQSFGAGTGILGVKITEQQRERLARFIKDDFVNDLIFSKYYKIMDDDQKKAAMRSLRSKMAENKDIREEYRESMKETTQNFMSRVSNNSKILINLESTKENIVLTTKGDDSPVNNTRRQGYEMFTPRESPIGLRSRAVTLGGSILNITGISPKKEKNRDFDFYMNRELLKQAAAKEEAKKKIKLVKRVIQVVDVLKENSQQRFARIRKALKEKLFKCVELKLTPQEMLSERPLFPCKPFDRSGSYAFIKAAKYGDQETVEQYLKEDRFYIFEYDQVRNEIGVRF